MSNEAALSNDGRELIQQPEPAANSPIDLLLKPPGGFLVWLFIAVELATFAGGFGAFLYERSSDVEVFRQSQETLDRGLAAINTGVLLISGFLVAQAVKAHHGGFRAKTVSRLLAGALLGVLFLGLKAYEYTGKLDAGLGMGKNTFFAYYWGLTGFHFAHVGVGVALLLAMAWHVHRGGEFAEADAGLETGAAFWHLCDLIWVALFPLLYILK